MEEPFAQVGMGWAKGLIAAAALAGLTSVLLVMLLGSARILMAMSRDGLLPPLFSTIHPSFRTPWKSTLVVGVCVAAMGGLLPLDALLEMTNIGMAIRNTNSMVRTMIEGETPRASSRDSTTAIPCTQTRARAR